MFGPTPVPLMIDPPEGIEADDLSLKDLSPVSVFPWSPPPPPPDPEAPPSPPPTHPETEVERTVLNQPKPAVQVQREDEEEEGGGTTPPPPPPIDDEWDEDDSGTSERKMNPRLGEVIAASIARLSGQGFVSEGLMVLEAGISRPDISRVVSSVDAELGVGLNGAEHATAVEEVQKALLGLDGKVGQEKEKGGEGEDDDNVLNKIKRELDKEKDAREEGEEGGLKETDPSLSEDDPDMDNEVEKAIEDAVNNSEEGDDFEGMLPVVQDVSEVKVFDALDRVGVSQNQHTWKALLREVLMKALDMDEIPNAALPNKRQEGQLGGREDVTKIGSVLIMLDASGSMGELEFKAVLTELMAMSSIWPYSDMFADSTVHLLKWASSPTFIKYKQETGFSNIYNAFKSMGMGDLSDPRKPWIAGLKRVKGTVDLHINMGDGLYDDWNRNGMLERELKKLWMKKDLRGKTMWVFPDRIVDSSGMIADLHGGNFRKYAVAFKKGGG